MIKNYSKKIQWLSAFTLMVISALFFIACNDNDDDNPNIAVPKGLWWALYNNEGTFNNQEYNYVGQALQLNADGTGYTATFYFKDNVENFTGMRGGKNITPLTYTVKEDGRIRLNFSKGYQPDIEFYSAMNLQLDDKYISGTFNEESFLMELANDWEADQILEWDYAANGGNELSASQRRTSIENDGTHYSKNYPFRLNYQIDKGTGCDPDNLDKSGSISLDFWVYPVYLQSSNGQQAGDYYFVTCAVTPHNNSLWGPYVGSHGWTRNRVYGYWFKEMDLAVQLVNEDGTAIEGLQYYNRPIPENQNDSRNYSSGKNYSLTSSLSGGGSEKQGFNASMGVSFGCTWTSSTSYTLTTINYTRDSSTPTVKYHYYSENVKLKDDMDNIEANFPTACHTEFTAHSSWVWYVPYDESGEKGVKDFLDKRFRLKASVNAVYSSWYHWRGSAEFDSNRKDYYDAKFNTGDGFLLLQPNRVPWGVIALKNAMSTEMAHVKFYRSGEENGEPVLTLSGSYAKNQVAKASLAEGTYTIIFDQMDPNNNRVISQWVLRNITVHQGRDEASATTDASTVDAQQIRG